MDSLNSLRAILVATAVIAALVAAGFRQWGAVTFLSLAILAHGAMWVMLYRRGELSFGEQDHDVR